MEKKKYFFALFLIFIVGGLDAYCYILHDGMFAAMQTGNMIQIAIRLASGRYMETGKYILAILSFVLGIVCAHFLEKTKNFGKIAISLAFLCYAVGFALPIGKLNILANSIMSFGVAIQLQVIRSINGFVVATTMCTGNLRGFSECLSSRITTKDKKYSLGMLIYSTLIISFMIGVFAVAMAIHLWG